MGNHQRKNGKVVPPKTVESPRDRIEKALNRIIASKNRPEDVAEFKRLLLANPDAVPERLKDLAAHAANALASKNEAVGAVECARFGSLRRELGYESSSVVERLLIDQVALCYLRLNQWEKAHATRTITMHTLGYGQFREKRLSAAQARYLRAIETLVRVRRLLALAPVSTVTAAPSGRTFTRMGSAIPPGTGIG